MRIRITIDEFIDTDGNTIELKVIKWRSIKDNKDTLIYGMVKEMVQKKIKL